MRSISSASFLKEFTLYAEQVHDEGETLVVQRSNDKNLVLMSLTAYNKLQKELFDLKKQLHT